MNYQQFKRMKVLTASFVSATVAIAVVYNNIVLALAGVLIGLLFLFLVRRKTKAVLVDERIQNIGGRAARLTYTILTITIAFLSLVFIIIGRRLGEANYEMLGIILSYITLFSLAFYSLFYKYFSKKYGETDDEQD
ncbi:MAG: DUF2178 domain-containing protein [Patescibacteria group bacterium]|nr:DUF2178 domain-containing protein [Patescibacteria group bacterium]MDD5490635.1 DUF2178 domain-containing protein [Patescibacteria group bacterium]